MTIMRELIQENFSASKFVVKELGYSNEVPDGATQRHRRMMEL
jgi:hypothetical protein